MSRPQFIRTLCCQCARWLFPILGFYNYICCENACLLLVFLCFYFHRTNIYLGWCSCAWESILRDDSISSFSSLTVRFTYVEVALGGLPYYLELLYLPVELTFWSLGNVPFPLLFLTTFSPPCLILTQSYQPSFSGYLHDVLFKYHFTFFFDPLLDLICMVVVAVVWVFESSLIIFVSYLERAVNFHLMYWIEPYGIANIW